MISRYEAYMDGTALSAIDPTIYVLDIEYPEIKKNIGRIKVAKKPGSRIIKEEAESTSVAITFEIHEYDIVKRRDICNKVQKWADGSILVVSDRPGQWLRCVCESYPTINARDWTSPVSMTFTAYNPPYWLDDMETSVTVVNSSQTAFVPGNAPRTFVSAEVTVLSAITSCELSVGDTTITLTGLSTAVNDKIRIGYDENNILFITQNGTSIMDKRTSGSADDLTAVCGAWNTFSAPSSCSTVFTMRGCWR